MIVAIDSREKQKWRFAADTVTSALPVGDYSIVGYLDKITLERKAWRDLWNCLSERNCKRLRNQAKLMRNVPIRVLVVEASIRRLLRGDYYCALPGEKAIQKLLAIGIDYDLPIIFADYDGEYVAWQWLCAAVIRANKLSPRRELREAIPAG